MPIDFEREVSWLADTLQVTLPASFLRYLREHEGDRLNGLPVAGLSPGPGPESVWGCTELIRAARPDLEPKFVGIRLIHARALALDLRGRDPTDGALVEIALDGNDPPRPVHDSFAGYVSECQRRDRRIEGALRRVRRHLRVATERGKAVEHEERTSLPRPHEWRVFRSCVHDYVIALTAMRHNDELNSLEVDVFISTDHPDYEPGHGVEAGLLLLFADAYRFGTSMEVRFTRYDSRERRRVLDRVPDEVTEGARTHGVLLAHTKEGIIAHGEAAELYARLAGLGPTERDALAPLEREGRLSLAGLSFLLGTRLWLRHEVLWLLRNSPRADGVLYGADLPEDRIAFQESVAFGSMALAVTKLVHIMAGDVDEMSLPSILTPHSLVWDLEARMPGRIRVVGAVAPLTVTPGARLRVLARPREQIGADGAELGEDARVLVASGGREATKLLVYTQDVRERVSDLVSPVASHLSAKYGLYVCVIPFTTDELAEEVAVRMSRARQLRP